MQKQFTFFLIDDDEDDRELFRFALDEMEFKPIYVQCPSCCDALEMLEKGKVKPDFIFLDLNMPQMNGRECLKELKKNISSLHIPVIIFSTSSDPKDITETKDLGAVEFITKPSKTTELTRLLDNFIRNYQLNPQHK